MLIQRGKKITELNLVTQKVLNMSEYLSQVATACIMHLPKKLDIDPNAQQEILVNYFSYFWSYNFSLEEQFQTLAEMSEPDPVLAFTSFRQALPSESEKSSFSAYKSRIKSEHLAIPNSDYVIDLLNQIASSVFLKLMINESANLKNNQKNAIDLYLKIYDLVFPKKIIPPVHIVASKYWAQTLYHLSVYCPELLMESCLEFLRNINDNFLDNAVIGFTFFSNFFFETITAAQFDSFLRFLNDFPKFFKKNQTIALDKSFTEFVINFMCCVSKNPSSIKESKLEKSWSALTKFAKSTVSKNDYYGYFLLILAYSSCFSNLNSSNTSKSAASRHSFVDSVLIPYITGSQSTFSINLPSIGATSSGNFINCASNNNITALINNQSNPNINSFSNNIYNNSTNNIVNANPSNNSSNSYAFNSIFTSFPVILQTVLMSFSIILRGPSYDYPLQQMKTHHGINYMPPEHFIEEKTVDLMVKRIVENPTLFSQCQNELSEFIFLLSVYNFDLFINKYFPFFTVESFNSHNIVAMMNAYTLIFSLKNSSSSSTIMQNVVFSTNKFLNECQIKMAPTDLPIFEVNSFVSSFFNYSLSCSNNRKAGTIIKDNLENLHSFILDLRKISLPIIPLNKSEKPKNIGLFISKWQSAVPNMMKTSLFDDCTKNIARYEGFTSYSERVNHEETLVSLNLICFTLSLDMKSSTGIASFIFSSSVMVSSLAIHSLQAIIHIKPHVVNKIFNSVCSLVRLCPTVENSHLFRIFYTLNQLYESLTFMNLELDNEATKNVSNVIILGLCSPHYLVRNEAFCFFNNFFDISIKNIIYDNDFCLKSSQLALKTFCYDSAKKFDKISPFSFQDILFTTYNNIYQFYLANFAKELRERGKVQQFHEYLFNLIKFFELDSIDPLFVQNLLVFVVNSMSLSFSSSEKCDFLLSLARDLGRQCSPALFCAIESSLMPHFIRPIYEILTPLSFSLTMLMDLPDYDSSFILKALDENVKIVIEKGEFSKETENGVDTSVFHVMHAIQKLCYDIRIRNEKYHFCIFPLRKRCNFMVYNNGSIKDEKDNNMNINQHFAIVNETLWIAFLMLVSQCQGAIQKLTRKAMSEVLAVMPLDEEFWDSIFSSNAHTKILMNILCHFPKLLPTFVSKASSQDAFFKAICKQFEFFESADAFKGIWKINLTSKDKDINEDSSNPFSEILYKNCGYIIALAFCYLFSEKFSIRLLSFNLLASMAIPCAYLNGFSIEKEIFELKPFLTESLTVVCHQKIMKLSELFFNSLSFCSEQFISGVFNFISNHSTSSSSKIVFEYTNIINYIKPYFSSINFPKEIISVGDSNFRTGSFYNFFEKLNDFQVNPSVFQNNLNKNTLEFVIAFMVLESKNKTWAASCIQYLYELDSIDTLTVLTDFLKPSIRFDQNINFVLMVLLVLSHSSQFKENVSMPKIVSFCLVNFPEFSESISALLSPLFPDLSNISDIISLNCLSKEESFKVSQTCLQFGISLENENMAQRSLDIYSLFEPENSENDLNLLIEKLEKENNKEILMNKNSIDNEYLLQKSILNCIKLRIKDNNNSKNNSDKYANNNVLTLFWRISKLAIVEEIQTEVLQLLCKIVNFDIFSGKIEKPPNFEGFLPFFLGLTGDMKLYAKFVDRLILKGKIELLTIENQNNDLLFLFCIDSFPIEISNKALAIVKEKLPNSEINEIKTHYFSRKSANLIVDFTLKNMEKKTNDSKFFRFASFLIENSGFDIKMSLFSNIAAKAIEQFFFVNDDPNIERFLTIINEKRVEIPVIEIKKNSLLNICISQPKSYESMPIKTEKNEPEVYHHLINISKVEPDSTKNWNITEVLKFFNQNFLSNYLSE